VQKNRKIINNSAGDCSISLKFRTDFDHVTLDVPHISKSTGQRSRSQLDITYRHKNAIIQARISCRKSDLVKIIQEQRATNCSRS